MFRGLDEVANWDPFGGVRFSRHVRKIVAPEFGHQPHLRSGTPRRDRLIGAFAAGSDPEILAKEGLAHARQALGGERQVGDEGAQDCDRFGCAVSHGRLSFTVRHRTSLAARRAIM